MTQPRINLSKYRGKIIAIDGPAGSGKSTTARLLADRLGFTYVDTGAMYRALTWFALENGIEPSAGDKLTAVSRKVPLELRNDNEHNLVFINGVDVTELIRTPEVTLHVSEVSAHKGVREAMVERQRELARDGSVVVEGRDTTTVVFPTADIKIYLDASVDERARRRLLDMARLGVTTTLEEQEADIQRRDKLDSERAHAPLRKAPGAFVVDTSNMTIEAQVEHILSLLKSVVK